MLESTRFPISSAGSVARSSFRSRPIKRSISDGDLFSSSEKKKKKKAKHQDDEDPGLLLVSGSSPMSPIRCLSCQGVLFSWSTDKQQDARDPCGSESAMVNPPFMRSSISDKHKDSSLSLPRSANISLMNFATPRELFLAMPNPDPEDYLDFAWEMIKPAMRSIFLDEPHSFSCTDISHDVRDAWWAGSGEALFKLILEECGRYISAAIESLEGQCRDDPSVFLPLLMKCRLDFLPKFKDLCSLAGGYEGRRVDGKTLWESCLELLSSSSKKKAKHREDLESVSAPVNPQPIRCSVCPAVILSWKKDKQQDARDPCGSESSSVHEKLNWYKHQYPSFLLPLPGKTFPKNSATPRVFNIVLPKSKPDPRDHLEIAWGMLKPAITSIFLDEPLNFSCAAVFAAVRDAWWHKSGEALCKRILEECGIYISAAIESLKGQCIDVPSVFLPLLVKCRQDFLPKFKDLCDLADQGGRVGGKQLGWLCPELFPTHLCLASEVRDMVLSNILAMVRDQRLGKSVDTTLLYELMDMFTEEFLRESRFLEKPFLECAADFYAAEATQVLEQSDLPQCLKYVERRLGEEKEKCRSLFFFSKVEDKLIEVVEKELLGARVSTILEKGFDQLMDGRRKDDLHRMYTLFSETNLVGHLNGALSSYIMKTGRNILAEGSSLADFKDYIDQICTSDFVEDELLEKTVEQCFKDLGLPWKDRFAEDFDFDFDFDFD